MSFTVNSVFVPNRNGAYAFFALKEHLKSVGWTVPLSSDGTTYNGGGDQIAQAAAGPNGLDNPSAWFVVRTPDSSHSFMFQRSYLGYGGDPIDDSKYWRVKVSTAGFAGGNATVAPAAPDEGHMTYASTDASPDFDEIFSTNSPQNAKSALYHMCAQTVAPYQFWACAYAAQPDGRTFDGLVMMEAMKPASAPPGDLDPFVYTMGTYGYQNTSFAYVLKGTPDEVFSVVELITEFDAFPGQLDVDPVTLKTDLIPTAYSPNQQNRNVGGLKGISALSKQLGVDRGPFTTVTVLTPGDFIAIGSYNDTEVMWVVPWDGSVPDRSV